MLIRAEHNRKVDHELEYLKPSVQQAPVLGKLAIEVGRNPKRDARVALLEVRALNITLMVPRNHPQPNNLHEVKVGELESSLQVPRNHPQPHNLHPVDLNAIWV